MASVFLSTNKNRPLPPPRPLTVALFQRSDKNFRAAGGRCGDAFVGRACAASARGTRNAPHSTAASKARRGLGFTGAGILFLRNPAWRGVGPFF